MNELLRYAVMGLMTAAAGTATAGCDEDGYRMHYGRPQAPVVHPASAPRAIHHPAPAPARRPRHAPAPPTQTGTKRVELVFVNNTREAWNIVLTGEKGGKRNIGRVQPGKQLRYVMNRPRRLLPFTLRWTAGDGLAEGVIHLRQNSPDVERIVVGRPHGGHGPRDRRDQDDRRDRRNRDRDRRDDDRRDRGDRPGRRD